MIHYEHCPVCHSSGISKVLTVMDYTVTKQEFEIWQCAYCSLRFTQDIPEPQDIGAYYKSEEYISHTETATGVINRMYLAVRKYTLATKKKFVESQTALKKGSLLDVGAGTGAFLHHMQKAGWDVSGVEPDQNAIDRAATHYGLALKPSPHLFELQEKSFDAITLWHVLEHVHDLHGYMRQLKKLLKPGGKLIIAVPNYTSRDAELYGRYWAAYDVPRHLYHFSPASMHELTQRHRFTVQKLQPMWFDSFYVSLLSEKYKTGHANLVKGFINGFRSNSKAFSKARKASSLIYVLSLQVPA